MYLQGWLAVGNSSWALGSDDYGYVEAVAGQSSGGACHAESLSQRVPGFLAEDRIHQLDDLILCEENICHEYQAKSI